MAALHTKGTQGNWPVFLAVLDEEIEIAATLGLRDGIDIELA